MDERFLEALHEKEVAALRALAVVRRWPAGSALVHEGDRSDRILIVQSGRVKIVALTKDGTEMLLALRGAGDIVGELSAVDGRPHSAAAVALEPVTCLAVDRTDFTTFLETHPRAAVVLLRVIASRQREADSRRVEFGAVDSVGRVARRLAELAEGYGEDMRDGSIRITMGLTQADLAGLTGASREAVSRALRVLRDEGVISTERRSVTVHDLAGLRRHGG